MYLFWTTLSPVYLNDNMLVLREGITAAQTATSATQPQAEHGIQRMGVQIQVSFRYLKTHQLVDLGDDIQAIVVGSTVCKTLSLQLQHGARVWSWDVEVGWTSPSTTPHTMSRLTYLQ